MQLWMEKYVIIRDWKGRPRSLVIVGDLIQHSGEVGVCGIGGESDCDELRLVPEEHVSWSNAYHRGRHEVDGVWFAGKSHWRDVLGGQERFNCRDFQQETRTLEWGLPRI